MFCRLRVWEQHVPRMGTETTTTTTHNRCPVHNTLRRGLEVIAEDAIQRTVDITEIVKVGGSGLCIHVCVSPTSRGPRPSVRRVYTLRKCRAQCHDRVFMWHP